MINRTKAFRFILLVALPLLVVNLMGRNIGIGKENMIKEVANEVIGMVDDFKDKNGRLPVGLHEIGAPFEELMRPMSTRIIFSITNREKTVFIG